MPELKLVIMAAGLGSRYGGLKQIDSFGPSGEFLMDYAIYDAYKCGVRHICLIIRDYFKTDIESLMVAKWRAYKDLKFEFVSQETADLPAEFIGKSRREKPWGTAHILFVLKDKIKTPFIIMNADDFYGRDAIGSLANFLVKNHACHALISYQLQHTLSPHGAVTRGICEIHNGRLLAIDEVSGIAPNDSRQSLVSMNLWGFSPQLFNPAEELLKSFLAQYIDNPKIEYPIPTLINDLLKLRRIEVNAIPTNAEWFGVTYQEDKVPVQKKINSLIEKKIYPENLFSYARS